MELRQLRLFAKIVEDGSFSRAAAKLGVTQPALSRAVRALEDELGTRLLYRNGRGVTLTDEGRRFAAELGPLLFGLEALRARTLEGRGVPRGRVSLAMPPSVSALLALPLVRYLRAELPFVDLHLLDGFTGTLHEWLATGRVDIAVLNTHRSSTVLRTEPLLDADLYFVHRAGDAEAVACRDGTGAVSLSDIARLPLLLPGRDHGMRREIDAAFEAQGLPAARIMDIDSLLALFSLCDAGLGYGILAYGAVAREVEAGRLEAARIRHPVLQHGFVVATSVDRPVSVAAHAVIRFLHDEVERQAETGRLRGSRPDNR